MENQIDLIPSRNGELNIQYCGKTLYSRYNPSGSAEKLAGSIILKSRTIYLIPSPLLGYGLLSILNILPEDSILVGIEINQEIMAVTAPYIHRFQDQKRCQIYRLDDSLSLYKVFNSINDGSYRSCRLLPLNSGYQLHKNKYDSLFSSLEHFLQNYWRNRLTSVKLGKLWIKNLLTNLSDSEGRGINQFKTNKAVILTGAGESLEKTIQLINESRNDFFILAVDTAIQTLVRSGIYPDGVVNLEAQFHNLKDFYSLSGQEVRQFADMTAYPASLRSFKGDRYYFSSRFGTCALVDRLTKSELLAPEIPALGSVGVTALYVAGEITDGPIFMSGLDFSYLPGKSHAKESPFHDWSRLKENRLSGDRWYAFTSSRPGIRTPGKNNTQNLITNPVLAGYGKQLKDMANLMERSVFDLAERGLDLNIPRASHQEALELAHSFNRDEQKTSHISEQTDKRSRIHHFLKEELNRLERLIALWNSINNNEEEPENLLPLLKECDYIYFHFPDTGILPNTAPAFLVRAVQSARYYRRLISNLLINFHRPS